MKTSIVLIIALRAIVVSLSGVLVSVTLGTSLSLIGII